MDSDWQTLKSELGKLIGTDVPARNRSGPRRVVAVDDEGVWLSRRGKPQPKPVPRRDLLQAWTSGGSKQRSFSVTLIRAVLAARPPRPPEPPPQTTVTVTVFERSNAVRVAVRHRAAGRCEVCRKRAPFETADHVPFLEVHHLTWLADGGPDTVENAVAACPNCHRELHLGASSKALTEKARRALGRRLAAQSRA